MTIFILGAGVMQLPAIRIARELGWRSVVADGNPEAVGAALCDRFLNIDLKDRVALEAAAKRLKADGGLEGVFTAGTDFSASVAWVAERLGLPGIAYETALRASDKLRMREAFAAAGLSSPRFVAVTAVGTSGAGEVGPGPAEVAVSAGLSFPLVVKPADSMGARGCKLVGSDAELALAVSEALPFSRTRRAIVEEYIDGPEFSIDAVVVDGDIRIRGLADRHISFAPYFVELGHTMPSAYPRAVLDEVLAVFRAGVEALGIGRGAAKGDIKYCPSRGKAVLGEIAARLSGGYMSGWTYPYASGIEVTREALETAVGKSPGPIASDRGWVSAERAFISIPGRVGSIVGALEAQRLPFVKDLFLRVGPGERTVFPSNNVEKCGNVISQAPDRAAAVGAAEGAIALILIRLAPRSEETEAFLEGKGRLRAAAGGIWPPSAFELAPETRRILGDYRRPMTAKALESPIAIPPFPSGLEPKGRDWSGRDFSASADLALRLGGAELDGGGDRELGARFWSALVVGGAQAGLYVLDSARAGGR